MRLATVTPEKALETLCKELFSVEQLRRFLRELPGGGALVDELPSGAVSAAEFFHEAVAELKRAGMVDGELFEALIDERPKRAALIEEVAPLWGVDLGKERGSNGPGRSQGAPSPAGPLGGQQVNNYGSVGKQIVVQGDAVFHFGKDDE